ncbi:MAG: hypothetical protein MK095_06935 [Phycisphaerales bacterium]|nr:hypothetical protein [Phycisphaerales bacterium]
MVAQREKIREAEARAFGARRIVPWVTSIGVHLGLVAVGLVVTWSVIIAGERDAPERIVADFQMLEYRPIVETSVSTLEAVVATPMPAAVLPEPPAPEPAVDGATLELSQLLGSPAIPTNLLGDADESMPVVEFAGAKATNAKRIVYVVDASGSLVSWMQIVLNELFRSLEQLDDRQQFAIIFFQEDRAIEVPPLRRLQKATSQARRRAIDWISEGDNVVPGYGSNPVNALEAAFDLHPEVIFLLSDSITGSGAYEVDQASLLAALESMNPLRDAASGRRDVLIQCIQFLGEQEDRLGTMRRIAELHGGEGGYKVYDRKAMGLED